MSEPDQERALDSATETTLDPRERDIEAPDADAVEQATPVDPTEVPDEVHRGFEVDEWDAVEQARTVPLDDEY
ncbi:MAG TPA: hypothetical protein VFM54_04545 [Micromonosporaceae bacterium]|nr:hypothetical protein [Micromonosporaceae bacterium]